MLFEQMERTSREPRSYSEGEWEYLNRSGRLEAEKTRAFLSYWVAQFPAAQRDELVSRIKTGDDRCFRSATFELFLFALLRSIGCSVTVHPNLQSVNGTHPDFLATSDTGERAYVEAVLASEFSEAETSASRRSDVVLDAIEKIDSPNFFLKVYTEGRPGTQPNGRKLQSELKRWLSSLDPDAVARTVSERGHTLLPSREWEHGGWRITFTAIPKKPEERGRGKRVIAMLSAGARPIDSWEPIRDAIRKKENHYGELDHPLIVAANVDAIDVDRIDEMEGLFGEEVSLFRVGDPSAPPRVRRKPNGAWFGPKGPEYTRVSGARLFSDLNLWNIAACSNTLYLNPWGVKALPSFFMAFNHARTKGERMQWIVGTPLSEVLKIPRETGVKLT